MKKPDTTPSQAHALKGEIHSWLKQGAISKQQHDIILRVLSENTNQTPPKSITTGDNSSLMKLCMNYEREVEFLFRELLIARRKLEWNRAALREAQAALKKARETISKTILMSSRAFGFIQGSQFSQSFHSRQ